MLKYTCFFMVLIVNYQEGYAPMSFLWVSYPLEWLFLHWFAKPNTTLLYPGLGPAMLRRLKKVFQSTQAEFYRTTICPVMLYGA